MISQNIRIGLFPLHSFAEPGGVKSHVLAVHQEFQKQGYTSKIFVPRRRYNENYGQGIDFLGTSLPMFFNGSGSDLTFCRSGGKIKKVLARERFDILHFHNFGFLSFQILKCSGALNILTFHSDIDLKKSRLFKIFPVILAKFKRLLEEKVDGIIGTSSFVLDNFSDSQKPKAVIPNGIDLERFNPEGHRIEKYVQRSSSQKLNLLFVGRLEERKGLIYLLRAYQALKNRFSCLRLIVVGTGREQENCERFVSNNGLKDVVFEGRVEGEMIASFYRSCDIFVGPAIFGESFGIVLLEAMASGKPVVAFANNGYRAVLQGKGREFLAAPGDWRGLAKKIEILINNENKRRELSEWGRQEAKKYAWENVALKTLNFYDEVSKLKQNGKNRL